MTEVPEDWTAWIITTLLTALSAVIGTVVALTRFIGNRYASEAAEQKKMFIEYKTEMRQEIDQLKAAVRDCQEDRFRLAMQINELKTTEQRRLKEEERK